MQNGKVLVVGGTTSNSGSVEIYDPGLNTWTNARALNTARRYHTATLLPSGVQTYYVGGTLTVPANQPAGDYSGTFTLTVNYF